MDMEALGGELLVAGSQGVLQPPGSLWPSIWHFIPSPASVESAVTPRWCGQSGNLARGVFLG